MTGPGPKGPGGRSFPQLGVPFLEIPLVRTNSILGSKLGSPYFGKLPYMFRHIRYMSAYPGISLIPLVGDLSQWFILYFPSRLVPR